MVLKSSGRWLTPFGYGTLTPYGEPFQSSSPKGHPSPVGACRRPPGTYYPFVATATPFSTTPVWAPPLSLATTRGILSFPEGTEMFQFPSCPPRTYRFSARYPGIPPGGFPHSDISGSTLADSSPKLLAVYHVLHRPLAPRHPPCALGSLITCVSRNRNHTSCSVVKVPTLTSIVISAQLSEPP